VASPGVRESESVADPLLILFVDLSTRAVVKTGVMVLLKW
jgi:hypothetical protein